MTELSCPDCGERMEEGFVPNFSHAGIAQTVWHPGAPETTRFLGLKTGVRYHRDQGVPISAYRCVGCGLLRFYAREESASPESSNP